MTSLEPREWDSAFFGYPVASVAFGAPPAPADIRAAVDTARRAGIRLLYLFMPPVDSSLRHAVEREGAKAVGRKVDYSKSVRTPPPAAGSGNDIAGCRESTPQLEALALQSGVCSRFRVDDGFRNHEFERLYREWLDSSLRGDGGKQVFIAGDVSAPRGLITVEPGAIARIGLLAVDARQRGGGLGHRLVAEAERFCHLHHYDELRVATQAENPGACRFYGSCGFQRISETEIFHVWLTPDPSDPPPPLRKERP